MKVKPSKKLYLKMLRSLIAGAIAAGIPENTVREQIGVSIITLTVLLSLSFFMCIFHYGKRIEVLNQYLSSGDIPNDWRTSSKQVFITISGVGSWFFLGIIILMQFTVTLLVWFKYIS